MIGKLTGSPSKVDGGQWVIDVLGIGYLVSVAKDTSEYLDQQEAKELVARLHIHSITSEAGTRLYGFKDLSTKEFFLELISVDGVGPKTAMAVIEWISQDDFRTVVRDSQVPALCAIPGIGKKTAERILLELGSKYKQGAVTPSSKKADLVRGALVKMGYKKPQVDKALSRMQVDDRDTGELIKEALSLV